MNNSPVTHVIAGEQALADFRTGLTGPFALQLLQDALGRLLLQLAVGVGKTEWMVNIIGHTLLAETPFDLVVVLVPRKDILRELIGRLPPRLPRVILKPRPRRRCGMLDSAWKTYEQRGCGHLGRLELCAGCPKRRGCFWPGQFGKRLRQARLILATQQHLVLDPMFLTRLCHHTGATRPLLLLDESDLLVRPMERVLTAEVLRAFHDAQQAVAGRCQMPSVARQQWLELTEMISQAGTTDLQAGDWVFPRISTKWAVAVQRAGRQLDPHFYFPAFDLFAFARSDRWSRERLPNGDLRFAALPDLGNDYIIFSGSIAKELARYRLDPNHRLAGLSSPFADYRFEHPGTRWYNLACLDGAAKFFANNATRVLDFFAEMVARNIRAGKRTLLVARKKFVPRCADYLTGRLNELGVGPVQIVTSHWKAHDLHDPRVIALINYGVAGINLFEHVEAAYCLTSYYASASAIEKAVHDIDETSARFPITLGYAGQPRRRKAQVELPNGCASLLPQIAQWTLEQKEADVVVQGVGRVRPFTRPREVITFQVGPLPGVRYTLEFASLAQARAYFNIPTRRRAVADAQAEQAGRLKALGLSHGQIAKRLGVSLSTVKRYVKLRWVHEPL